MSKPKSPPTYKSCKQCGELFQLRSPSDYKTWHYCSKKCRIAGVTKKISVSCEVCGSVFHRPPSTFHKAKYCSRQCKYIGTRKIADINFRQCNKCDRILPIVEFYTNNNVPEYRCKECQKIRGQETNRTPRGRYRFSKCHAKRRNYLGVFHSQNMRI